MNFYIVYGKWRFIALDFIVFYIVFIKVFSRVMCLFDKNRAKENAHRAQFFAIGGRLPDESGSQTFERKVWLFSAVMRDFYSYLQLELQPHPHKSIRMMSVQQSMLHPLFWHPQPQSACKIIIQVSNEQASQPFPQPKPELPQPLKQFICSS